MDEKKVFNVKIVVAGDFERYKVYEKPVVILNNRGNRGKRGQAKDKEESIRRAMSRAKEKINGYIMANEWEYWATQTFNNEVIDRYNLDEIVKRYNMKLSNLKRRKYNKLQWLIVPEQHKDGAWHLHLFMSGIPKERVKYSGYDYFNKLKQFSRPIYNWLDTIDFGFNDYLYIADIEPLERFKMAAYITKYITKDLAEKRFNKKMYWCSKGLKSPAVVNIFRYNVNEYIPSDKLIITENVYHIKDKETGEIFNTVKDFTFYNNIPF